MKTVDERSWQLGRPGQAFALATNIRRPSVLLTFTDALPSDGHERYGQAGPC